MNKYFAHIKTVMTHKYHVAKACFAAGLYKQGILHDLSKFSYIEFHESVIFYQGNKTPINEARSVRGYSSAWLHHKGRNKHHFEYWVDYSNDGNPFAVQLPYEYAVEMACDMIGASRAYNGKDWQPQMVLDYWNKKKHEVPFMHPQTKMFLTFVFENFVGYGGSYKDLNRESMEFYYNTADIFTHLKPPPQWEQLSFF